MRKGKEEKKKVKKEKKKKKENKVIIIVICILLLILLGIGGYFGYKYLKKDTLKTIKRNYSEYVITKKDTKLYNKDKKKVGTIKKGFVLNLEEVKSLSTKNRYFKIKDTSYYIYFRDVKKTKQEETKDTSYYLPLNKELKTDKEVTLYDGKKEMITLKNLDTTLNSMDKDNYYVSFLGKNLRIKKSKDIKIEEKKEEQEGKANHVSNIFYQVIKNDCGGDTICLNPYQVKAHIRTLKQSGYYFITKEDYINYLNDYIDLKQNAVLLSVGEVNDEVKNLMKDTNVEIANFTEKDEIKPVVTNKTSTKEDDKNNVNTYQAKSYTIIDRYVSMASGADTPDNGKENSNDQRIAVLNYHFFFDSSIGEQCNESICLEAYKFREELEWLKNNGYKTLTIKEFADWMDGIIEIPDKSVLLTVDDGAKGTGAHNGNILIPMLEEYKMHATLFLISGWWDISNYQSPYLDVQSHSYNLHYEATCPDGRGLVACSDYQTVKNDLQQSLDILQDNTSFCFPFYSYDAESLQAVQELGFRVAFVGGSVKARRTDNHYLIPRYPIMDDITLNDFIYMVS